MIFFQKIVLSILVFFFKDQVRLYEQYRSFLFDCDPAQNWDKLVHNIPTYYLFENFAKSNKYFKSRAYKSLAFNIIKIPSTVSSLLFRGKISDELKVTVSGASSYIQTQFYNKKPNFERWRYSFSSFFKWWFWKRYRYLFGYRHPRLIFPQKLAIDFDKNYFTLNFEKKDDLVWRLWNNARTIVWFEDFMLLPGSLEFTTYFHANQSKLKNIYRYNRVIKPIETNQVFFKKKRIILFLII